MITAHMFARARLPHDGGGPTFGALEFARALRTIADEIDNGNIYPQSAEVVSLAAHDDFTSTTITLKLTEKVK